MGNPGLHDGDVFDGLGQLDRPSVESRYLGKLGSRRGLLLLIAAVIAGAGVAYELALMLLGTITAGSTERANAIVLGTAMLGMGIGASSGGRWSAAPVKAFIRIEVVLALLGASAAPALYWTWARMDAFWGPLLGMSVLIGFCIGAEMPLLAALNDRLVKQSPAKVVADYTAADYFGALAGALVFAFAIRPFFGIVSGTIAVAVVNLVAAALVALVVPGEKKSSVVPWVLGGAAGLLLIALMAPSIVEDGRQALFRDPIIRTSESGVQQLVVTSRQHPGGITDTRLFLDGDLQLSSVDEHRYHESLVHPAVSGAKDVLILGGGDCLAVREVLRHKGVESVTLVELDPSVIELMRTVPELQRLQGGSCDSDRLTIINGDAFSYVGEAVEQELLFDAVVVDFPDPDTPALGRLYSVELYALLSNIIEPDGRIVVQCGSPFFAPEAYWTCAETLEYVGFDTTSYHVDVPSFGDWGFHLARPSGTPLGLLTFDSTTIPGTRFMSPEVFDAAQVFPDDIARNRFDTRPSTLLDPVIVEKAQGAWIGYDG